MCFVCVSLHLSTSRLELGHRHCLCVCCPPLLCCRFATCLLLVMLSVLYPHFLFVFQVIIALDIVSHWMQMYRSVPIPWRGGKGLLDADVYRFAHIPWGGGRGHWMQMYRSAPIPWGGGRGWVKVFELCSVPNEICFVSVCSSLSRSQTSHKVDPTFSIVMAIYYRRVCIYII